MEANSEISLLEGVLQETFAAAGQHFWAQNEDIIVIDADESHAEFLAHELVSLVKVLQGKDLELHLFTKGKSHQASCDRLRALKALSGNSRASVCLALSPEAFFEQIPSPKLLAESKLELKVGMEVALGQLYEQFGKMGYKPPEEGVCGQPGDCVRRGEIIDIYPFGAKAPIRVGFNDNCIEYLSYFDPQTQITTKNITHYGTEIARELLENNSYLQNYLKNPSLWLWNEPANIEQEHPNFFAKMNLKSIPRSARHFNAESREAAELADAKNTPSTQHPDAEGSCGRLGEASKSTPSTQHPDASSKHHARHFGFAAIAADAPELFRQQPIHQAQSETLGAYRTSKPDVHKTRHKELLEKIREHCQSNGVHISAQNKVNAKRMGEQIKPYAKSKSIRVHDHGFSHGFSFELKNTKMLFITEAELLGQKLYKSPPPPSVAIKSQAADTRFKIENIQAGEHLVHVQHGPCIFEGLQSLELADGPCEVLSLQFDKQARLHLRPEDSHLLSRYIAPSAKSPKLGNLHSRQWERTCLKAQAATLDIAAELLETQAQREGHAGYKFSADGPWVRELEASFPYTMTPDQDKAIKALKADMESKRCMDRLLCADAGYGKTEVALRAAFKAILDGKQVALLAPTTILCQQHLRTFSQRFAPYPIAVEMLNRLRSLSQRNQILEQLARGTLDCIIGTHALLSPKVHFHDLGLLIIDEEHRFGVSHKERLKQLRAGVDVLSMSATPIPRTLQLALGDTRKLSLMETPPANRRATQTHIVRADSSVVRKAIGEELSRKGQIFYLHNHIDTLDAITLKIQKLFPEARVAKGHGRMHPKAIEATMESFAEGQQDILICTTLIENGIDIPNCNTLLVHQAQNFGLSQLYQIRGRIGRSDRQAYCYLLIPPSGHLSPESRERLGSLRQFTRPGSGYRIAMRDLEIRGAGQLLGTRQHGHINAVGFELYCQLLQESIRKLQGKAPKARRAKIILEQSLYPHIPESYIPQSQVRLQQYRRCNEANSHAQLEKLSKELRNRFGTPPAKVLALIELHHVRIEASENNIDWLEIQGDKILWRTTAGARRKHPFPCLTQQDPICILKAARECIRSLPE